MNNFIKTIIVAITVVSSSTLAFASGTRDLQTEETNRKLVVEFYDRFFNKHDVAAAQVVADNYKQHNPHVPDGKTPFVSYFENYFKQNPKSGARIVRSVANDDLVWIHVHSTSGEDDRGSAIVDIFRVTDGKITEHWDVIQDVPENAANENTMF